MKEKKKKVFSTCLFIVLPLIIGCILGFVLGKLKREAGIVVPDNILQYGFIVIPISVVIALFGNVVIHEAGHLLFGLLGGYRFVSFRIGSFTLVKVNGSWKIKRFNIPGTGGQCLMAPPKLDAEGDYPFTLYNLGGIAMNLAAALICFAAAFHVHGILSAFLMTFACFAAFLFITNGVPAKIGGVANDGLNLFSLKHDMVGKRAFYVQLSMNAKMSNGIRLKDLPFDEVRIPEGADLRNPINAGGKLFEYYWYADRHEFDQAQKVMDEFAAVWDEIVPMIRNVIGVERIYLELIGENQKEVIDQLLTDEMKLYLKRSTFDVHSRRVTYGLTVSSHLSQEEIEKALSKLKKTVKQNPVQAEAQMSWELSEYMIQTMKNRN